MNFGRKFDNAVSFAGFFPYNVTKPQRPLPSPSSPVLPEVIGAGIPDSDMSNNAFKQPHPSTGQLVVHNNAQLEDETNFGDVHPDYVIESILNAIPMLMVGSDPDEN